MNRKVIDEDIRNILNNNLPWDAFANKTILVTGANGFLPAYMIKTMCYLNDVKNYNIQILAFARNKKKHFSVSLLI